MLGGFKTASSELNQFPELLSDSRFVIKILDSLQGEKWVPLDNMLDREALITYYLKVYNIDRRAVFVRL